MPVPKPTLSSKLALVADLVGQSIQQDNKILSLTLDEQRLCNARINDLAQRLMSDCEDYRHDLDRAEDQLASHQDYVHDLSRENRSLQDRVNELEAMYRVAEENNRRLVERTVHLEEYILDCTCREAPLDNLPVSVEIVYRDPTVSSDEDSEMTDEEMPTMPHDVVDLTEDDE